MPKDVRRPDLDWKHYEGWDTFFLVEPSGLSNATRGIPPTRELAPRRDETIGCATTDMVKIVELTGDQHSTYWTAVATIVPVLALALVLEGRLLGRRWSKQVKKVRKLAPGERRLPTQRWTIAGLYMLAALSLPILLTVMLFALRKEESSTFAVNFATIWILLTTFLVAYIPAAMLMQTALFDFMFWFANKFPWSQARRYDRQRKNLLEAHLQELREVRWEYVELLMFLAVVLVRSVPEAIAFDRSQSRFSFTAREAARENNELIGLAQAGIEEIRDRLRARETYLNDVRKLKSYVDRSDQATLDFMAKRLKRISS